MLKLIRWWLRIGWKVSYRYCKDEVVYTYWTNKSGEKRTTKGPIY